MEKIQICRKSAGNRVFYAFGGTILGIQCCVAPCLQAGDTALLAHAETESPPTFYDIADAANWLYDLFDVSADAYSILGTPGAATVSGMVMAVYCLSEGTLSTGHTVDTSSISAFQGMYYDATGKRRLACLCGSSSYDTSSSSGGALILSSHDMDIYVNSTTSSPVRVLIQSDDRYYSEVAIQDGSLYLQNAKSGRVLQGMTDQYSYQQFKVKHGGTIADIPPLADTALSGYFNRSYPPVVLACGISFTLPTGTLDPANPSDYIDTTLRPYVETNYPDYIDLLPEPAPEPTETMDPSAPFPGLPVIKAPTVPRPEYDLTIPQKMLEGCSFWFTALTEVLDYIGWLPLVIAILAIALVLYYVF